MHVSTVEAKDRVVTSSPYPCLCAMIRKVDRIVTRNYEKHLKPCGLKVTQLSMLSKIARNPLVTASELAESLRMDQTTVSRNLLVLEKSGYVRLEEESTDHRIKRIQIADCGLAKIEEAKPLWEKAQQEMELILGRENIDEMLKIFGTLTRKG